MAVQLVETNLLLVVAEVEKTDCETCRQMVPSAELIQEPHKSKTNWNLELRKFILWHLHSLVLVFIDCLIVLYILEKSYPYKWTLLWEKQCSEQMRIAKIQVSPQSHYLIMAFTIHMHVLQFFSDSDCKGSDQTAHLCGCARGLNYENYVPDANHSEEWLLTSEMC